MLVHIKSYFNLLAADTCFAFYFSFFVPAHCLHAYTLIGNIQQKFLCCCMSRQKALAFLVLLLALWWRNKNHKRSTAKGIKYAPLVQRDIWRSSELIRLIDTSDRICMRELRMSRPVFYKLCARLRERGLIVDTLHVSVEEQLAMFLKIVGQYHTHSSVAIAMWRSGWTVSTYFNAVLRAIVKLAPELIYVRSTSTHPKITKSPNRFYPYFEVTLNSVSDIIFICNFRYISALTRVCLYT